MQLFWIVVAILIILAIREFIFLPFKEDPYNYRKDENGDDVVIDETDKDPK